MWLLVFALCAVVTHGVPSGCPFDTIYDDNHDMCYKYVPELLSYFKAEEDCRSRTGHLASIKNAFDNGNIAANAEVYFSVLGSSDFWVGGNTLDSAYWSWADGSTWSYSNWAPTNGANVSDMCLSPMVSSGRWFNNPCDIRKPYVCAFPVPVPTSCPTQKPCPTCPTPVLSTCSTQKPCPTCPTPVVSSCPTQKPPACPTSTQPGPHCESGWMLFNGTGSCYQLGYSASFWAAENNCINLGGHLASIHSAAENSFVNKFAMAGKTEPYATGFVWIGMYRNTLNQWQNTDGSPANFFSWTPGEPDDVDGNEDCVEVNSRSLTPMFFPNSYRI